MTDIQRFQSGTPIATLMTATNRAQGGTVTPSNADTDVDLDQLDRSCLSLADRLEYARWLLTQMDEQSRVTPPVGTLPEGKALMTAFSEARKTLHGHVLTLNAAISLAHDNLLAITENYRTMERLNAQQFSGLETTVQ